MGFKARMTLKLGGRKKLRGQVAMYYTWPHVTYAADNAVLLKEVTDELGRVVTPWFWFKYTKGFRQLGRLEKGEMVEFEARVVAEERGRYPRLWASPVSPDYDYRLRHPLKVRRVEE